LGAKQLFIATGTNDSHPMTSSKAVHTNSDNRRISAFNSPIGVTFGVRKA
jgi:hypothetical protein